MGPAFLRGENGPSVTLSLSVTMSTSRQPQMFKNSGAAGLRGVTCAQHCPQHLDASCLERSTRTLSLHARLLGCAFCFPSRFSRAAVSPSMAAGPP